MSYRLLPPPKPRRSPLILMVILALIPAIALAYTWRWAEAKIPTDAELAELNEGSPSADDLAVTPVVALSTPMLSMRRAHNHPLPVKFIFVFNVTGEPGATVAC